jgi:hypothetical protein
MTASTWIARAKDRIEFHLPQDSSRDRHPIRNPARRWVGIDFSGEQGPRRARRLLPLLVLALVAALGVSALRIDLIRVRYAMASVLAEEKALIEEQRALIVKRRQLRDPVELATQARARGFRPLSTVLSLSDPMPGTGSGISGADKLPSVAMARPTHHVEGSWQ